MNQMLSHVHKTAIIAIRICPIAFLMGANLPDLILNYIEVDILN